MMEKCLQTRRKKWTLNLPELWMGSEKFILGMWCLNGKEKVYRRGFYLFLK